MGETYNVGATASSSTTSPFCSGIFAYLNYLVSQKRLYVLETLIKGLKRLEYRGYDSAGACWEGRGGKGEGRGGEGGGEGDCGGRLDCELY